MLKTHSNCYKNTREDVGVSEAGALERGRIRILKNVACLCECTTCAYLSRTTKLFVINKNVKTVLKMCEFG